jgi:CBS domain-containing protein
MLAEGDISTAYCADGGDEAIDARATEDTLVYSIPCDVLFDIVEKHPEAAAFLKDAPHRRLSDAVKSSQQKASQTATLMNTPLSALISDEVIDIDHEATIHDAAVKMTRKTHRHNY